MCSSPPSCPTYLYRPRPLRSILPVAAQRATMRGTVLPRRRGGQPFPRISTPTGPRPSLPPTASITLYTDGSGKAGKKSSGATPAGWGFLALDEHLRTRLRAQSSRMQHTLAEQALPKAQGSLPPYWRQRSGRTTPPRRLRPRQPL